MPRDQFVVVEGKTCGPVTGSFQMFCKATMLLLPQGVGSVKSSDLEWPLAESGTTKRTWRSQHILPQKIKSSHKTNPRTVCNSTFEAMKFLLVFLSLAMHLAPSFAGNFIWGELHFAEKLYDQCSADDIQKMDDSIDRAIDCVNNILGKTSCLGIPYSSKFAIRPLHGFLRSFLPVLSHVQL